MQVRHLSPIARRLVHHHNHTPSVHRRHPYPISHHSKRFQTPPPPSRNVDPREVSKFSILDWWNPNGSQRMLHKLNPIRVRLVRSALARCKPVSEASVLDVGCGGGLLSEALARIGADVTGVDASEESILMARRHWENVSQGRMAVEGGDHAGGGGGGTRSVGRIRYVHGSLEDIAKEGRTFDLVIASEVMEHVPDTKAFAAQLRSVVSPAPGSSILVTTLSRNLLSYSLSILMAESIMGIVPRGTHSYSRYICPSELDTLFVDGAFEVSSEGPIFYDVLSGRWEMGRTSMLRDWFYVNYYSTYRRIEAKQ